MAFDPEYREQCAQIGGSLEPPTQWPRARLASDGLYHLVGPSGCEARRHRRLTFYEGADTVDKAGLLRWCGPEIDAAMAPNSKTPGTKRCDRYSPLWPGSLVSRGHLAIRRALVDEFGLLCQACRKWPATDIDHDKATGRVRGYLCDHCNHAVNRCVHLRGCPYAEYLNGPPAYHITGLRRYEPPKPRPESTERHCVICDRTAKTDFSSVDGCVKATTAGSGLSMVEAENMVEDAPTVFLLATDPRNDQLQALVVLADTGVGYFREYKMLRWAPDFQAWVYDKTLASAGPMRQTRCRFVLITPEHAQSVAQDFPHLDPDRDAEAISACWAADDRLTTTDLARLDHPDVTVIRARPRTATAPLVRIGAGLEGTPNTAGYRSSASETSPVVVHVPHAGLAWPDDTTALPDYPRLRSEITLMADLGVDQIADIVGTLLRETGDPFPNRFDSLLTRVAMDPERFDDDTEEMNRVGMGVVYTRTHTGRPLYSTGLSERDVARRKKLWYEPYSDALDQLVSDTLAAHGRCLIVDLHSYSVKPLAHELHKHDARPEVCLGYEPFHDPGIEAAERVFARHGYTTARNQPYQGSYVPLTRWRKDPRLSSVMVEIRKDQYLDKLEVHHGRAVRLAAAVAELIRDWQARA